MTPVIEDRLLDLLACPRCGGELGPGEHSLTCFSCGTSFEVRGGIPVLMPEGIDLEHLAEEEKLGEIMTGEPASEKDAVSEEQWKLSKREYWDFVRERISAGKTIVNIGCGVDTSFLELAEGNTLIAFDLMRSLLEKLRDDHGSRFNVTGAVQSLPFRDDAFDAICCIDLIHHEPDRLTAIFGSFARILAPGGILFLEDINAWGLTQFWKSKMMPRRLHGALREGWHRMKGSRHRPAPYEFPTDVFGSMRMLEKTGFTDIEAVPLKSYPNTGRTGLSLYGKLSSSDRVQRYHNFHYMITAKKPEST
ncbi:MAG: methyltransferase domain-containing protein [Candidatus Krumholzibacteria bacterium]|nr:methyltransferase domain-containing protein [Candidatus Krumholzibacteria bacterium]